MDRPWLTPRELQLADVVQPDLDYGYNYLTVKQITASEVVLVRPFIHTADFSYTGGVLTYIGLEEVRVHLDDTRTKFQLFDRKTLK